MTIQNTANKNAYLIALIFLTTFTTFNNVMGVPTVPAETTISWDASGEKIGYTDTNDNFQDCSNGFTIAGGSGQTNAIVTWDVADSSKTINGPIHSTNARSILKLNTNLYFGPNGSVTGDYGSFSGNGNTLFLGQDTVLNFNGCWISSSLTIDGQNHKLQCQNFGSFYYYETMTLKNMAFSYAQADDAEFKRLFYGMASPSLIFNNVSIQHVGTNVTAFCDSGFSIEGTTTFTGITPICLASTTHIDIAINSTGALIFDNTTIYTGSNGVTISNGTVIFDGDVTILNRGQENNTSVNQSKSSALKFDQCAIQYRNNATVIPTGRIIMVKP